MNAQRPPPDYLRERIHDFAAAVLRLRQRGQLSSSVCQRLLLYSDRLVAELKRVPVLHSDPTDENAGATA